MWAVSQDGVCVSWRPWEARAAPNRKVGLRLWGRRGRVGVGAVRQTISVSFNKLEQEDGNLVDNLCSHKQTRICYWFIKTPTRPPVLNRQPFKKKKKQPLSSSVLVLLRHLTSAVALWLAAHHGFCALLCRCCGTGIAVGGVGLVGGQILHAETPQFVWQDPLTLKKIKWYIGWLIAFQLVLTGALEHSMRIPNNKVAVSRSWKHQVNKKTKNVQSLHYLCCRHDCSCGSNIESFSPKMHQRVADFVLRLADIFIHVLKPVQNGGLATKIG